MAKTPERILAAGRKSYHKHRNRRLAATRLYKANHKDYYRNRSLVLKYNLTLPEYNGMLASQQGACAICLRPPTTRPLHVDHEHSSGVIRGLLCFRCNYGLSWFRENPAWLENAAAYLRERDGVWMEAQVQNIRQAK